MDGSCAESSPWSDRAALRLQSRQPLGLTLDERATPIQRRRAEATPGRDPRARRGVGSLRADLADHATAGRGTEQPGAALRVVRWSRDPSREPNLEALS